MVKGTPMSVEERMRLFDEHTRRVKAAQKHLKLPTEPPKDRGWTREELYDRDLLPRTKR